MAKNNKGISVQKTTTKSLSIPEELGLVPALAQKQILQILQRTPKEHIYRRPAKGGGMWDYVTGTYVEKVLNYVFGWDWSFEVKQHGREGQLVWVLGKLSCSTANGKMIVKEQFGRADVKKNRTGGDLDYGNDLKAAATDALKKCASLLGVASDIYGKEEFKDIPKPQPAEDPEDSEPATEGQKKVLDALKIEYGTNLTRGDAKQMILKQTEKK